MLSPEVESAALGTSAGSFPFGDLRGEDSTGSTFRSGPRYQLTLRSLLGSLRQASLPGICEVRTPPGARPAQALDNT
jgi:hypothetical protein